MKNSKIIKIYLLIAGLLLAFIGGSTLFMPVEMKASAGIEIAGNISVINDIRAFSSLLLVIALISISGAFVKRLTFTSSLISSLLFLSLGTGRLISILSDGLPVDGLVKATGLEFVLGIIGMVLFIRFQEKETSSTGVKVKRMNSSVKTGLSILLIGFSWNSFAQKNDKKIIEFSVERIIQAPVHEVWKVVGEDFGAIANSHPKIVSSKYNQGELTGGENVTRTCNFNEKGTKYLQEKQISFDAENYTFKVQIYQSGGIPINTDYSFGVYTVIPIDSNSCKLIMKMGLRTKPSVLGGLAKGQFKNDIADYLLAVEHHVLTGEIVNNENFREIKKKYSH